MVKNFHVKLYALVLRRLSKLLGRGRGMSIRQHMSAHATSITKISSNFRLHHEQILQHISHFLISQTHLVKRRVWDDVLPTRGSDA